MELNEVFTAVYDAYMGDATLRAAITGLYLEHAPPTAAMPYAVMHLIGNSFGGTFTDEIDEALIQFSIFSSASGSGEITSAVDALTALYDFNGLTYATWSGIECRRQMMSLMWIDDSWQATVDYMIMLQKVW